MSEMDTITDIDCFFYYGQNDLEMEVKSDVLQNLMQAKRSLFYDRSFDSAGITKYENYPDGLTLEIGVPFAVVESLAMRNYTVSDGQDGTRDRRVAVSQSSIEMVRERGSMKVNVYFYLLATMKAAAPVSLPLGGV